jgi:hypothetical protein
MNDNRTRNSVQYRYISDANTKRRRYASILFIKEERDAY